MHFVKLASAALCLAALPFGSAAGQQSDAAIFQNTIRHVDMNGTYLEFINTVGIIRMVNALPDRFETLVGRDASPETQQAFRVIRVLLKALNLSAWKANAISSRQISEGIHLTRCYSYWGSDVNAPGIASLAGRENVEWKRLGKLPIDTRIALGGDLQTGKFWEDFARVCSDGSDPLLAMLVQQIPQLFEAQTRVRFPELLASISGPYEFLLFGGVENPGGLLVIPDRQGHLSAWLRQLLNLGPNQKEAPFPLGGEVHPALNPVIRFEKGCVILFSSVSAEKRLASVPPGGLLATEKFAPYFKQMPKKGTGYCIVNLDEVLRGELLSLVPPADRARTARALGGIELNLVSMAERGTDGFGIRAVTNASLPEIKTAAYLVSFAGSLLPSLSALPFAPDREDLPCAENLKQLGLGCIIYANEHEGALPGKTRELVRAKAVSVKALRSPASKKKTPYVFLGGLNLKTCSKPAQFPIAFDAPGTHKSMVHVLFADGHVEKINVANYRTPEQVIGALNRRFHYAPEELRLLRSKVQVK